MAERVKITVVKKVDMRAIHSEYIGNVDSFEPVCPLFHIGEEFIVEGSDCPQGFCMAAFADIYRFISGLKFGANYPWMKEPGTVIACCTDGFRPVVFKLERIKK